MTRDLTRTTLRRYVDTAVGRLVAVGGVSVIVAILLIFIYLASVVLPLLEGASAEHLEPVAPGAGRVVGLGVDDNSEFFFTIHREGRLTVHELDSGAATETLSLEAGGPIARIHDTGDDERVALERAGDGALVFADARFPVGFVDDRRVVRPRIEYPFDPEPVELERIDAVPVDYEIAFASEELTIAALMPDGRIELAWFAYAEAGLPLDFPAAEVALTAPFPVERIHMGGQAQWLYALDRSGRVALWDIRFKDAPELVEVRELTTGQPVTASELLLGGFSLLLGDASGTVRQWFPVRGPDGAYHLDTPRAFATGFEPTVLVPEARRKGFVALSEAGDVGLYHTTAGRTLLERPLLDTRARLASISPRGDYLLLLGDDGALHRIAIDNEHPEVSLKALWAPVWYEGYQEPVLSWQSSAANNDFEPKFSLTPLAFGTLKAALYAMLFAIPLAIMGAIYTAYFMSPVMRGWVKPTIEIMEALPTVILGFLAGLWLAPLVEANLTAVLGMVLVLPPGLLAAGLAWHLLPQRLRARVPDGWHAALLVPVVCGLTWLVFALGPVVEQVLFGGDLQGLLLRRFGLAYDQRNALVVGLAMGLAVIPTIFSIAEDAIFSVPRNLVDGSLALGATPWQTLSRVVLLTASPGIFSAVMIGFGRAVGETMIVLMATGNTPVLDLSIFQGMRTFSANIAVELPESEVNGTHYRILFLAALVLFGVTFLFNTAAELVRQRLRSRYGSL